MRWSKKKVAVAYSFIFFILKSQFTLFFSMWNWYLIKSVMISCSLHHNGAHVVFSSYCFWYEYWRVYFKTDFPSLTNLKAQTMAVRNFDTMLVHRQYSIALYMIVMIFADNLTDWRNVYTVFNGWRKYQSSSIMIQ